MRRSLSFLFSIIALIAFLASPPPAQAQQGPFDATVSVCFTPGGNCTDLIVRQLGALEKGGELLVQAYSFTSAPIAQAVVQAFQRGVDVRVILDKSQRTEKYSGATYLANAGIPVVIDERPSIAHSKIMVLNRSLVIGGSFNFTAAAQQRNAENLVFMSSRALAAAYVENWQSRWALSVPFAARS